VPHASEISVFLPVTTPSFNPASVAALLSTVVCVIGGVGAWLLGHAPDWEDVRPLSRVGLSAALAAASAFSATLLVPEAVHVWSARVQVLALALHVAAWYAYFLQWASPGQRSRRWWVFGPLLAAGALALVPGAVFEGRVVPRAVPWLGVVYHDPVVAPLGFTAMALVAGFGAVGVAWLVTLRGRVPYRRSFIAVTSAILAMCVHDAVAVGGLALPTPYLIELAVSLAAIAIAMITLRRIVETATDLRRLRTGLEVLVVERTAALQRAQAALFVSERLAALGQFAGGFAREVEHPAKVVEANLEALGRELRDDPRDRIRARLADARGGIASIATLARQLLVAGRAAVAPAGPPVDVRVGRAVEAALTRGRSRDVPGVSFHAAIAPGLTVSGQEDELVEVLTTLVLDGMARLPGDRGGTVAICAVRDGERVRITVEDDGQPLSDDALLHAFEPFHDSERRRGTGLRRAVARGLVEGMGGRLALERLAACGTRAVVELAPGAPDASAADLPQAQVAAPLRARILLAHGDPVVVRAVLRDVGQEHELEAVTSVAAALAALGARSFDVVLCDAALPGGGGERFWEELLLRAPAMLGRVAFLLSGQETGAARAFLDRQPQPVLRKPFGLAEVQVLLDWLGVRDEGPDPRGAAGTTPRPLGRLRAP
jgi:signal transduction histidine kinase